MFVTATFSKKVPFTFLLKLISKGFTLRNDLVVNKAMGRRS